MKKAVITAAALLVFGGSVLARGEQGSGSRTNQTTLEVDSLKTVEIDQVQVTAFRAGEKTPVAYTNLTKREVERVNTGVDVPFMLTMTPSVVATSDAGTGVGYTSVSVRGTDGTRINVTANGVPLNDGESHKLYWVNLPDFASSAGDIQVQRGVGTSTNGAGAFGASINITTEPLSTTPFAEIGASYGSFNTHRESVHVGTGLIGGRWAFGARLSNISSDGYVDRASSDLKSYFAQGAYFGRSTTVKLISFGGHEATYHAWNGLEQWQIDLYGRRYNSAGEIYRTDKFGSTVTDADGNPIIEGFYPDQKDFYTQYNTHLIIDQQLSERWNLNLTGHYTRGDGYYEEYKNSRTLTEYGLHYYEVADENGALHTVKKSNLVRRKAMWNDFGGAIASLTYKSERLDAVFGGAWNRYAGDHFGRIAWIKNYVGDHLDPSDDYYRNTTDKRDANLFVKASWTVTKGLSLYGDLQYRHISHRINGTNDNYDWRTGVEAMQGLAVDKTYNFFNPKVGLYYDITPRHALYASVAVAHKEPTRNDFTDAAFDASPRPERLLDYELGYKLKGERVWGGVNLYYMNYRDQLVQTGQLNDIGEPLADNVARSYRAGVEVTLGVKLAEWLRWDVFSTFSRNRILDYTEYLSDVDETGESLWTQTAEERGNTTIAYSPSVIAGNIFTFTAGGFYGAIQTNFVNRQYLTNSQREELTLPAYCTTNLRVSYRFPLRTMRYLEVGVSVGNLFNAKYSSYGFGYSSLVHLADGSTRVDSTPGYFPQATTNVLGSITLSF
jgi:iron complex outermembrane receptor protein